MMKSKWLERKYYYEQTREFLER